jgi:hypothetical protein
VRFFWVKQPLESSMDNVLAWKLGKACNAAAGESAGDHIDRGLALRRHLELEGFGLVLLAESQNSGR